MKLDVIKDGGGEGPWYEAGLNFTCTACGNCCTGGPGFVWISREEVVRLAEYLKITPEQALAKYCRKVDGQWSLKEYRNAAGNYDCVFLQGNAAGAAPGGSGSGTGGGIAASPRGCTVYPVRPLQCRTWPFWPENLGSKTTWDHVAKRCHGMNAGERHFSRERIESLRDAKDWPQNPPTSGRPAKGK